MQLKSLFRHPDVDLMKKVALLKIIFPENDSFSISDIACSENSTKADKNSPSLEEEFESVLLHLKKTPQTLIKSAFEYNMISCVDQMNIDKGRYQFLQQHIQIKF